MFFTLCSFFHSIVWSCCKKQHNFCWEITLFCTIFTRKKGKSLRFQNKTEHAPWRKLLTWLCCAYQNARGKFQPMARYMTSAPFSFPHKTSTLHQRQSWARPLPSRDPVMWKCNAGPPWLADSPPAGWPPQGLARGPGGGGPPRRRHLSASMMCAMHWEECDGL